MRGTFSSTRCPRNLSLSLRDAPTLAALDSVENAVQRMDAPGGATADTSGVPFLVGTAAVTGIVRGAAGLPVADAEVRVANAAPIAATDSAGRYTLRGLPAGTQLLFARRIGYATLEADIELRAGRSTGRDVQLQRVVSLDSIRVIGQRSRYREFEYDRGSSFFGKFLTGDEIERYKANELTDILLHLGGFTISGRGLTATVLSNAVKQRHPACTESNVVIDGVDQAGINYYPPTQVAGLEVYRDGTTAPALYRSDCGLILIWTKRYRAPPRHEAPPDSVVVPAPHVSSGAFPSGRHGVQQGSLDLDAMDPAEQHRIGQGSHHASE